MLHNEQEQQQQQTPQPSLSINVEGNGKDVLVSVVPPPGSDRTPCEVCCVIDISGSMSTVVKLKGNDGEMECHGLTVLDIVKHATKTIIHSLTAQDSLALVTFETRSKVVMPLKAMDEDGRRVALEKVESLSAEGYTNLWGGLEDGMKLLKRKKGQNQAVFILTDGAPNERPKNGELECLREYRKNNHHFSVNTFGFGYSLDSVLLDQLAKEGGGSYAFIPDASLVGTVFVNALTSLITTVASEAVLTIEPCNGTTIPNNTILEVNKNVPSSDGAFSFTLGTVCYGQSRDVLFEANHASVPIDIPFLRVTLTYTDHLTKMPSVMVVLSPTRSSATPTKTMDMQRQRQRVVSVLLQVLNEKMTVDKSRQKVEAVISEMERLQSNPQQDGNGNHNDAYVEALLKDLKGETMMALESNEPWQRWGRHFLPSLVGAHRHQRCNNFKDFGVQHYASPFFLKVRDEVDDTFLKIPPPKPSAKPPTPSPSKSNYKSNSKSKTTTTSTNSSSSSYTPVNMSAYYNMGGGCIAGHCSVVTQDAGVTRVDRVSKGDRVRCLDGGWSRVLCVVKTMCQTKEVDVVALDGGLVLTPFHPVLVGGVWYFPVQLAHVVKRCMEAVYDFVLEQEQEGEEEAGHVLVVNGIPCVTLGHHLVGDVVSHPYFGSDRVVDDLKAMKGWEEGLVTLKGGQSFVRSPSTGLVCGLKGVVVAEQEMVVVSS